MNKRKVKLEFCKKLQSEGIGSLYERVQLVELMSDWQDKYKFESVLEYPASIVKGYDNWVISDKCSVTVADEDVSKIKKEWMLDWKPKFKFPKELRKEYDLVWNFAQVQLNPEIIVEMKKYTRKYVLIFVPNLINIGAPIHIIYHLLSGTKCNHAERGNKLIRTYWGFRNFVIKNDIEILESGYFDSPPIPDIAFSIKELKKFLGIRSNKNIQGSTIDEDRFLFKLSSISYMENTLPLFISHFISHHLYILGKVEP
jgi:hypothetical protein